MRIPSGVTDQYIYFVAVDSTDFTTRETGLSSFTVYRSRNGAAAVAMTTPTINETSSSNMPGVYELLLDEDMTIGSGNDTEEMVFHITATGMAPVTRSIELYRPKITAGNTLDVTATGEAGIDLDNVAGTLTGGEIAVGAFASGAITAAAIATDAITAAKIATDAIGSDELATTAVDEIANRILPATNTAFPDIAFVFVAASDHVTPVTAASGTAVTRSIDGGAFASATGTLAEIGNGLYQFDASAADMNGKQITFRFTATGGTPGAPDDAFVTLVTNQ